MAEMGLGCVKTPAVAERVEECQRNCPSSELHHTLRSMRDAGLENRIFYISVTYEFSHSQGHERTCGPGPLDVRFTSQSGPHSGRGESPSSARTGREQVQ